MANADDKKAKKLDKKAMKKVKGGAVARGRGETDDLVSGESGMTLAGGGRTAK